MGVKVTYLIYNDVIVLKKVKVEGKLSSTYLSEFSERLNDTSVYSTEWPWRQVEWLETSEAAELYIASTLATSPEEMPEYTAEELIREIIKRKVEPKIVKRLSYVVLKDL